MLSRVADSLYWTSRYLERALNTARMTDTAFGLALDQEPEAARETWRRLVVSLDLELPESVPDDPQHVAEWLTLDRDNPSSIVRCVIAARDNARQVRELISGEMWEAINRMYLRVKPITSAELWMRQPHDFYAEIIQEVHLVQGVIDATLLTDEGWHFLMLGRFIERANLTTTTLDAHFAGYEPASHNGHLDKNDYIVWVGLLKSCTAFDMFCRAYSADVMPGLAGEFLLLDSTFPRSVRFAAERVCEALEAIDPSAAVGDTRDVVRLAGRLRSLLTYSTMDEIMAEGVHKTLYTVRDLAARIHTEVYNTYFDYPIETAWRNSGVIKLPDIGGAPIRARAR